MSDQPPTQPTEGASATPAISGMEATQTPTAPAPTELAAETSVADTSDSASTSTAVTRPAATGASPDAGADSAAAIRAQVEKEQALKDAQRRVRALEEEVGKVKGEKTTVEGERDAAVQTTNQLRTQFSTLQSTHHKSASELSVLQTRVEIIEREKKELLEETERLQERSTRSNQELYTLRAQKGESAQKIAHLDVEVSELRLKAESAKFNENRAQDALVAARAEILRLSKAAADVEERFGKYRAEKQSQYSILQTEHDTALSKLTTTQASYSALQRSYNDQSTRLATAHADINDLTSAAASRKAASQNEVARLVEENRVLSKRADETRSVVAEREAELEQIVAAHEEAQDAVDARIKTEERRRKEAEKRAQELKAVVDRLALAGGEGTDLSPAAALAGEMRGQGKSYTQFFTDYTLQQGRLQEAEDEVARLTELLDEISNDIAEKKPLLDEQAAEHAAAIDRANALAGELALVMTVRDAHEETIKSLRAEAALREDDAIALKSATDDISRQLLQKIRELEIRDDPSLANEILDPSHPLAPTGDYITDHLLEFKSLRQLQEQNFNLLKVTRALQHRLDQREIRKATAEQSDVDTIASLDAATETIEKLHQQLLDAQKKVNEATRERDVFGKLLARGEGLRWGSGAARLDEDIPGTGGSAGTASAGVQANQDMIDALRAEIAGIRTKAEEEIKVVRDELKERMKAVGEAEVAKAKAEARAGMLQEQARSLTDVSNLEKQNVQGLESQVRQIQVSLQSAQNEARQALEQAAMKQSEADRMRSDVAALRAEKEQWTSTESRLQADFRTVQAERTRLAQLIENMNGVSTENDRTRSEERIRLEKRVDELQRETTDLRTQLATANEATRTASTKLAEAESALEGRIAEATQPLRTQIASFDEERLKLKSAGLSWQKQFRNLRDTDLPKLQQELDSTRTQLEGKNGEVQTLQQQLGDAQGEKTTLEGKIKEVEAKVVAVTRAEGLKEQTVQRLQSELSKKAAAGDVAALQSEKQTLQTRITQLENELATARATPTAASTDATVQASAGSGSEAELTSLREELAALNKASVKYDDGVVRVNRANLQMKQRIDRLVPENNTLTQRVGELEQQLASKPATSSDADVKAEGTGETAGVGALDQAAIDEAVRNAVSAKEAELNAAHAKALEEAKSTGASSSSGSVPDQTAIQTAVAAREKELAGTFDTRLAEAVAKVRAELEKERDELKAKIDALNETIKGLERQVRTAEITRKTLQRTADTNASILNHVRTEVATKGIKLDTNIPAAPATAKPAPASATAGSAASAPTVVPTAPASAAIPIQAPAAAQPPTGPGAATRSGSTRGRGGARGGAPGRGGGVLAAVNAAAGQRPAAPSAAQKRPAPEEGEISESAEASAPASSAAATGTTAPAEGGDVLARLQGQTDSARGRQIKRPRGAGAARGAPRGGAAGAAGRRTSTGAGATAAAPPAEGSGDAGQSSGDAAGSGAGADAGASAGAPTGGDAGAGASGASQGGVGGSS